MQVLKGKIPDVALQARLNYLNNSQDREIPFHEVIPGSEQLFTRDEMVQMGWVEEEVY